MEFIFLLFQKNTLIRMDSQEGKLLKKLPLLGQARLLICDGPSPELMDTPENLYYWIRRCVWGKRGVISVGSSREMRCSWLRRKRWRWGRWAESWISIRICFIYGEGGYWLKGINPFPGSGPPESFPHAAREVGEFSEPVIAISAS